MRAPFRYFLLILFSALLGACGSDPGYDKYAEAPSGGLRVINAVSDSPALVVEYGTQSIGNINFSDSSSIANVIPGLNRTTTISYVANNELQKLAETTILVPQDELVTVILTGTMDNVGFLTIQEDTSAPAEGATTTELILVNATSGSTPVQVDVVDSVAGETRHSISIDAGVASSPLAVPETTGLSINTINPDNNAIVWTSGDFTVAPGLRPLIILVDHYGPSPNHRGLYLTPIGQFPFGNESLPSALTLMNLIPDRTSVDLYARTVRNSNPFSVFVDIDESAEAGNYSISLQQLATMPRYRLDGEFESGDVDLGYGEITVSNGDNTATISIAEGDGSLSNLVIQINASEAAVNAELITLANENVYLAITPNDVGLTTSLVLSVDDGDGTDADAEGLSRLASSNLVIEIEASASLFTVDGVAYERPSNQVDDVIEGATLYLFTVSGDEAVEFAISERELMASALGYLETSDAILAEEGSIIFYITPPGEPDTLLYEESLSILGGAYQLVTAGGIGETLDFGLAIDPRRPISKHKVISVLHAAPSTAILDFYVLRTGRSIKDFTPSGNDIPLLSAGFYNLTGDTYQLTVAESSSKTVLAGPLSIETATSGIQRVLILDANGGGTPPQLVIQDTGN